MLRQSIVIGGLLVVTQAAADPIPLTSDTLKETVSGALVEIDTPLGTTIPVRFATDGMVSGESGELAPILGSPKDRGRWWIEGDRLCSKWFRWFDSEPRCITLKKDGAHIFWTKDDGETGTATIVEAGTASEQPKMAEERAIKKQAPTAEPLPAHAAKPPAPATAPQQRPPTVLASASDAPTTQEESPLRFSAGALVGATPAAAATAPPRPPKPDTQMTVAKLPGPPVKHAAAPQKPKKVVAAKKADPKATPRKTYTVAAAAPPPPAQANPTFYRVTGVDDDDILNVRSGPSENHAPIAAIPSTGRRVEINGHCLEVWCPIRYGRITGWVNRLYLVAEDSSGDRGSSSPVYFAKP